MKKTLLQFTIAIFTVALLISATIPDKKGKIPFIAKNSEAGEVNPNLIEIISYSIINGNTIQSLFVNFVFSQFTTKSAAVEDSVLLTKTSFEYLDSHSVQTISFRENNQWVDNLEIFIYRPASQLLYDSLVYKSYDSTLMSFSPFMKYVNHFDLNGNDILNIGSQYDNESSTWIEMFKTEKSFLDNNLVYQEIDYFWNDQTVQWEKSFKTSYAYDNAELIFVYEDLYNGTDWEPYRKEVHDRNVANDYYSVLDSIYDYWTFGFKPAGLDVYSGIGNTLDTAAYFSWNDTIGDWDSEELYAYNYEDNGNIKSVDFYANTNKLEKSVSDNMNFQKVQSLVYYYSNNNTSVEDLKTVLINAYPNPVKDEVQLQVPNPVNCWLNIFNIHGKRILTRQIHSRTTQIDISNFENGIYLFRVDNNGESATKKIVKQ